jgi:hypothetical protein
MDNDDSQHGEDAARKAWDAIRSAMKKGSWGLLAVAVTASMIIGGGVGAAIAYPQGRDDGVETTAVEQVKETKLKADSEYQKLRSDLADANNTIAQADAVKSGIDDLNKQHDGLEQQVKDAQTQLDGLTKQVDAAKKNSVTNGTWQVGKDIDPGTYRANDQVGEDRYWEIKQGDDIVSNDLPGGGYPQATVSAGQQLKLQSCGTWSKQ